MKTIISEKKISPKAALGKIFEHLGYQFEWIAGASGCYAPLEPAGFNEIVAEWAGSEAYAGFPAIHDKAAYEGSWRALPGIAGRSWHAGIYWLADEDDPDRLAPGRPRFVLANPAGSRSPAEETYLVIPPDFSAEQLAKICAMCESAKGWF